MLNWTYTSEKSVPLPDVIDLQQYAELYKSDPPPYGHALHKYFGFDPEYINLNHGEWNWLQVVNFEKCFAFVVDDCGATNS